jgi:hypothetical protein
MCQFVCIIRGCLYERRDGTFADSPVYGKTNWTGRDGRDPGLYKFLLYLSPGAGCIKLLITFLITIL